MPGRPTNLDYGRARAGVLAAGVGMNVFISFGFIFICHIILVLLPLSRNDST